VLEVLTTVVTDVSPVVISNELEDVEPCDVSEVESEEADNCVEAAEYSVVGVRSVVTEFMMEVAMLSLVADEVCTDIVWLSVETGAKDEVADSDSMEDTTTTVVRLGTPCDVSKEVGFDSEATVETGGADSVDTMGARLSV
jgi:hypothetical protein